MSNNKQICTLDFDDFSEKNNRLDWLWKLHNEFPNFKVNLFTISDSCSEKFIHYIDSLKWIQLCMHGFFHKNNEEIPVPILKTFGKGRFNSIYRAPFWQLSDKMYERLKKLDYKIMLHPDDSREGIKFNWNIKDSPPPLKILYGHGHVQDYPTGPKGNGLIQAFENILKLPKDTEFKFL